MMKKPKKTGATHCPNGTVVNLRLTQSQHYDLKQIKTRLSGVLGRDLTDTLILRRALARYHFASSQMPQDLLREESLLIARDYR